MTPGEAAAQLARSFHLSEGFALHYAIATSPVAASSLLSAISLGDDVRPLEVLDAYSAWGARATRPDEPLSFSDLETAALAALERSSQEQLAGSRALIVNASCAHPADLSAWTFAFARLNEGRNRAMRRLPTNVVLLLDAAIASPAILTAPDVWSVRTNQLTVETEPAEIEPSQWSAWAATELSQATHIVSSSVNLPHGLLPPDVDNHLPVLEEWIPPSDRAALANADLSLQLSHVMHHPHTLYTQEKADIRATIRALGIAAARGSFLPVRAALLPVRLGRGDPVVAHAVCLLAAYEAFSARAFADARDWFAAASAELSAVTPRYVFGRIGQCLCEMALGRFGEARRQYFELEAFAASSENQLAARFVHERGGDVHRLFGDSRRAQLADAMRRRGA